MDAVPPARINFPCLLPMMKKKLNDECRCLE